MALTQVPQANQTLNQTQAPILNNFAVIDAGFSKNHVEFNNGGATEGMHNAVNYVNQNPGAVSLATGALQSMIYAGSGVLSGESSALFIKGANSLAATVGVEFTAGSPANPGFAIIPLISATTPNGLVIKWFSSTLVTNVNTPVNLNSIGPNYTTLLNVQVSVTGAAGDTNGIYIVSAAPASVVLYRANNAAGPDRTFYLLTIGI
jgi:hypothetical protein